MAEGTTRWFPLRTTQRFSTGLSELFCRSAKLDFSKVTAYQQIFDGNLLVPKFHKMQIRPDKIEDQK